jgi:two-component system, LytTR family, response regulator
MTSERMRIRVLIIDDEPPARRRVERLLSRDPEIEVIGNCAGGPEALVIIGEQEPDIIFLDVEMPRLDGFEFLEAMCAGRTPLIIFVTAYDRYAVRAFEVCAFDYLLKPYDQERFDQVLQRAKERIRGQQDSELSQRVFPLLKGFALKPKSLRKLIVKTSSRVFFLNTEEIDWIKAEGKYARLYTGRESHLWRGAISELEAHLDSEKFVRIHRSTIVNIDRVKELHPLFHGEYEVLLRDGTRLTLSRRYRDRVWRAVGSPL